MSNHVLVPQPPVTRSNLNPATTWIVDGGPHPPSPLSAPKPTLVIAADSGFHHAQRLGLKVDVVVGDLDSIETDEGYLTSRGILVERHPTEKDASDLALAVRFAQSLGAQQIHILTGGSGRLDHLITGLLLLGSTQRLGHQIVTHCGNSRAVALRAGQDFELETSRGSWITLIAIEGDTRVHTEGLRWNFSPAVPLTPFSSEGLSNEILAQPTIEVRSGIILVIATELEE